MGYSLAISSKAENETIIALKYYDEINSELGDRFLNELSEVYGKISTHPEYYSYLFNNPGKLLRSIQLNRFPFIVVFEVQQYTVYVTSVWNTRKKPEEGS